MTPKLRETHVLNRLDVVKRNYRIASTICKKRRSIERNVLYLLDKLLTLSDDELKAIKEKRK